MNTFGPTPAPTFDKIINNTNITDFNKSNTKVIINTRTNDTNILNIDSDTIQTETLTNSEKIILGISIVIFILLCLICCRCFRNKKKVSPIVSSKQIKIKIKKDIEKNTDTLKPNLLYNLPIKVDKLDTDSENELEIKEKSESLKKYIKTLQDKIKMMHFIKKIRQKQMDERISTFKYVIAENKAPNHSGSPSGNISDALV